MNEMVFHTGVHKIINLPWKLKVEMESGWSMFAQNVNKMRKNYLLIYKMHVISRCSWTLE